MPSADLKLGRSGPSPHDSKRLSILDAIPAKLPSPPGSTNRTLKLAASKLDILGNDRFGDCTVAGAGHTVQLLTHYETDRPDVDPEFDDIVRTYFDLTGGQDSGLDLLTVLKRWRSAGIAGRKIEAYAECPWATPSLSAAHARTLLKTTIWLAGSAYVAAWLPAGQQGNPFDWRTVGSGPAWRPGSWGGHAVCAVDYSPWHERPGWTAADGIGVKLITWGRYVWASERYLRTFMDEVWCPVSADFTNRKGLNPQSRTLGKLVELAHAISAS